MSETHVGLVELYVRPRAQRRWKRDAMGRLVLGVAAPPAGGAANEEARRAIAEAIGVPPSRVTLYRGARSRVKVFRVVGVEAEELKARMERLAPDEP